VWSIFGERQSSRVNHTQARDLLGGAAAPSSTLGQPSGAGWGAGTTAASVVRTRVSARSNWIEVRLLLLPLRMMEANANMSDSNQRSALAAERAPDLYPVFLKLAGRRVLVVGGGNIARTKLVALVAAKAVVTVVAPQILPEIKSMGVHCVRRPFRAGDLAGAWYVVSAAPPHVNRHVERAARKRQLFVNAVDDARRASSYLGGVVRKGSVTLAISTEGHSPALAGLLREALAELLPDDIEQWLALGQAARTEWDAARVPHSQRRPLLLRVLNELYGAKKDGTSSGEPLE
jgi:precorrin-2 dehydrogenase / sirohydrochlorin ferrochelatase